MLNLIISIFLDITYPILRFLKFWYKDALYVFTDIAKKNSNLIEIKFDFFYNLKNFFDPINKENFFLLIFSPFIRFFIIFISLFLHILNITIWFVIMIFWIFLPIFLSFLILEF
jgi:hypothetical protein